MPWPSLDQYFSEHEATDNTGIHGTTPIHANQPSKNRDHTCPESKHTYNNNDTYTDTRDHPKCTLHQAKPTTQHQSTPTQNQPTTHASQSILTQPTSTTPNQHPTSNAPQSKPTQLTLAAPNQHATNVPHTKHTQLTLASPNQHTTNVPHTKHTELTLASPNQHTSNVPHTKHTEPTPASPNQHTSNVSHTELTLASPNQHTTTNASHTKFTYTTTAGTQHPTSKQSNTLLTQTNTTPRNSKTIQPFTQDIPTNLPTPTAESTDPATRDPTEPTCNNTLSMASINIQNIKSNTQYLQALLKEHDIICIQEHWLFNYEQNWINNNIKDIKVHTKSVDDEDPISHAQKIRGYGGVSIICNNKQINDNTKQLPDGNTRTQVLEVKLDSTKLLIVNCYMPCRNSKTGLTDYDDALDTLGEILTKYTDSHNILLAGDFNASLTRQPENLHDKKLKQFIAEHNIHADTHVSTPTFYHHNGRDHSQIDYIFYIPAKGATGKQYTLSTYIHTVHPLNTSDHTAITAKIPLLTKKSCRNKHKRGKQQPRKTIPKASMGKM